MLRLLRLTLWGWVLWTLASLPVGWAAGYGQEVPSSAEQGQEEFLEYRLRPGESLSDIARLFRLPVEELARINRVADPTRLQVGQPLKVPNVFARQVAQLLEERNRLLAEKEQMESAWLSRGEKTAKINPFGKGRNEPCQQKSPETEQSSSLPLCRD